MNIDVDKIVVSLDVVTPDAVVVEASAVAPSGIVTEAVAELPTQVIVISHEETPTVTPVQIIDFSSSSIECAFDVATEQAEEVVKGVLCGTINPPTFENADYRLLHGQGNIDLAFAGLRSNTEYYLRPYALSNLGYKYGDVVAQRTSASPIPSEYQLVEYLKSDTNQFIFLDYIPNGISNWFIDLVSISGDNQQCGLSTSSPTDRYVIANSGGSLYIGMGNGIQTGISITGSRTKIKLLPDQNKYEINGVSYNFASSFVGEVYKLCLFARNVGGLPQFGMSSMFYYSYIEELGEKKLDMYPVYRKSDNKPGIYDIVNGTFYTNQGTGEFTVGPDKEWEE